jgi:hypothetical protein
MFSERLKVHIGLTASALVLMGCFALIIGGAIDKGDLRAGLPGTVAPDFSLRDADNKPVQLSELRGNVVVVYFHGQGANAADGNDVAACPTSAPTDSVDAAATAQLSQGRASIAAVNVPTHNRPNKSAAVSNIAEVSAMCRDLHDPCVKLLDLEAFPSTSPSDSIATAPPTTRPAADSTAGEVETLFDPSGDVAREFKIDKGDAEPTVIVIDPSGVIRSRGSSLQLGAASTDDFLSPATQPLSSQQMAQTLFT